MECKERTRTYSMEEHTKYTFKISNRKFEYKGSRGRPNTKFEGNDKIDIKELVY
jgi:hypothetical protein